MTPCEKFGCRNLKTVCIHCGFLVCEKTLPSCEKLLDLVDDVLSGLKGNIKCIEEDPDERYPVSFNEGLRNGLAQARDALEAALRLYYSETPRGDK